MVIKTTKSLKYHLDQFLYKHVVCKEITHSFICPVKELNQPHKSILTTVSVTQHFNYRICKLLQDFHDPFMPMLHNAFIHLSKPRAGSTCPDITPLTTPTLIELVTLSRNAHKPIYCCSYHTVW